MADKLAAKNDPKAPEYIARVMMMANGDGKWDLSPNDCMALAHVLDRMRQAEAEVARLEKYEAAAMQAIHIVTARASVALPPEAAGLAYKLAIDHLIDHLRDALAGAS